MCFQTVWINGSHWQQQIWWAYVQRGSCEINDVCRRTVAMLRWMLLQKLGDLWGSFEVCQEVQVTFHQDDKMKRYMYWACVSVLFGSDPSLEKVVVKCRASRLQCMHQWLFSSPVLQIRRWLWQRLSLWEGRMLPPTLTCHWRGVLWKMVVVLWQNWLK